MRKFVPLFAIATVLRASLFAGDTTSPQGQAAADDQGIKTVSVASLLANRSPVSITGVKGADRSPSSSVLSTDIDWSGDSGAEMARISALTNIDIQTNGNELRSVIRAVCEQAAMRFIIVSDDPVFDSVVTLSGNHHPWKFLQSLASIYDLEIVFRQGLWQIYSINRNQLVQRTYQFRHDTLETFKANGASSVGGGSNQSQSSSGQSNNSNNGNSGGSSGSSASIDRSGQSVFSVDSKALTDAVGKFIGLNTGGQANLAGVDGSFGNLAPRRANVKGETQQAGPAGMVQFNPGNNTLFVVATRAQHELLAAWIAQIDQPQKQIQIESKFLLTSVSPTSHTGVSNPLFADSGVSATWSGLQNKSVDPFRPSTWTIPTAIFSASDLTARLSLVSTDSDTTTVQYPQQVTLSGREVTLRSVRQVPIISSQFQSSAGVGTNTQANVTFVDVGTVVAILPKVLNEKNVLLNISIVVSSIVDTTIIAGNPYPVVATQTYQNEVIVESGYSLALGGLEQAIQTRAAKKLPFFGDLPVFGFLMKEVAKTESRSVLTMIVTPYIMNGYNGGNTSGLAQQTLPARGTLPRVVFEASPDASTENVQVSLRGFSREVDELAQINKEGRGDSRQIARAKLLVNELDLMQLTLKREKLHGNGAVELEQEIDGHRVRLRKIISAMPNRAPIT